MAFNGTDGHVELPEPPLPEQFVKKTVKQSKIFSFRSISRHIVAICLPSVQFCKLTGGSSASSGLGTLSSGPLRPPPLPPLLLLLGCSQIPPLPRSFHLEGLNSLFHHGAPSSMQAWKYRPCMKNAAKYRGMYTTYLKAFSCTEGVGSWSVY